MDVSSAQSNSTLLDVVAAQAQQVAQNSRPVTTPATQQQPSTEVTLSRDARERANQPPPAQQPAATATNVSNNPVQAPNSAQPASEESSETAAAQSRESENREQQANVAVQAQTVAPTYTARLAAQSYTNVSNF